MVEKRNLSEHEVKEHDVEHFQERDVLEKVFNRDKVLMWFVGARHSVGVVDVLETQFCGDGIDLKENIYSGLAIQFLHMGLSRLQ